MERIGDDNVVAYGLHVERYELARQVSSTKELSEKAPDYCWNSAGGLLKGSYRLERAVIDIHAALGEVCCIQVASAFDESAGQARVAGSVGSFDNGHSIRGRRCSPLS